MRHDKKKARKEQKRKQKRRQKKKETLTSQLNNINSKTVKENRQLVELTMQEHYKKGFFQPKTIKATEKANMVHWVGQTKKGVQSGLINVDTFFGDDKEYTVASLDKCPVVMHPKEFKKQDTKENLKELLEKQRDFGGHVVVVQNFKRNSEAIFRVGV